MIRYAVVLAVALAAGPAAAGAQIIQLAPAEPVRWDLTGSIGWLSGSRTESAARWNDWFDTFAASIEGGRYWTPNIRTAVAGVFTTEGDIHTNEQITLPGEPRPIFFTQRHAVRLDGLVLTTGYQFGHNEWVHPFVHAGVQVARERTRTEYPYPAFDSRGRPVDPPRDPAETTRTSARPFAGGGAKFYVSEKGFFRTDLNVAIGGGGVSHILWRAGFGLDF